MKKAENFKAFEETVQKLTEKHMIPGTSVAIAQEGEIVYHKGFGFRNVEDALPVTEDTVFGIGSITKSYSCVAIMQLQEAGKLNVHDPVIKYLPEFNVNNKEALKQITIHHFMTHSSGLPPMSSLVYAMKRSMDIDPSAQNYPGLKIEQENYEPIDTYEQLMQFIADQDFELLGDPDTQFSYSNDAYALLGTIIERVSGKSYEQYVYDHILSPCGMKYSCFMIEEYGDYENITTCYAEDSSEGTKRIIPAPIWWDAPSMRAAGFLKSTAGDMLRYAEIFRNAGVVNGKRILSEESVKEMVKPHIQTQPGRFYGYGLMITPDYFGTTLVEHGGGLKAISAQLSILPEKGVSGVVLTNLAGVPAARVMQLAFNAYAGREVEASHISFEEYEIGEERLEQYQGEYESNEGMKVSIVIKDGKPVLISQKAEIPIMFVKENAFIAYVNDSTEIAEILVDDNNEPWGISYHFRQFPKVSTKQVVK
ncbi:serine hydrolase domain-containing protein [Cytobacillus firmus]